MQGDISEIIDPISRIEFGIADIVEDNSSIRYGIQSFPQAFIRLIGLWFNVVSSTKDIGVDFTGFNKEGNISVAGCFIGVVIDLDGWN